MLYALLIQNPFGQFPEGAFAALGAQHKVAAAQASLVASVQSIRVRP